VTFSLRAFVVLILASRTVAAALQFDQPFAPSDGLVSPVEAPYRQEVCLNGTWQFQPVPVPASFKPVSGTPPELPMPVDGKWESTAIKIPSPWNVNTWGNGRDAGEGSQRPYVADSVYFPSYPAVWEGVEMGWLRRKFQVPAGTRTGDRLKLHFEAVAGDVQVLVNGKPAGGHFDTFMPFDLDITDLVNRGGDNELLVGVRKSSLFNIVSPDYPAGQRRTYPNGSNMDNLVGIWNDVFLLVVPAVHVENVFIQPLVDKGTLAVEITVRNETDQAQRIELGGKVAPWVNLAGQDVFSAPVPKWRLDPPVLAVAAQPLQVAPKSTAKITLQTPVRDELKFWAPGSPNLYALVLEATGPDGKAVDRKSTRFGWRQFTINGRDLLLNGKKIQLWGDFIHPFGPFVLSRRYVWADYKMIQAFGGNSVRPHANPMARAWLDLADEMGMCVLDETAIFGSSINLNLKADITWGRLERHIDALVLRDRNHPSVMGWSSANEMFALFFKTSPADKEVQMAKLKALALRPRALDPTRPWISVDGDKDLDGTLPIWSRHIGTGLPDDLPDSDKPRMIGEQGGTYYAGPPRLRDINGQRSYESYAARNEALAIDVYRMITQCAKSQLVAFSPSELVWFGLEQLPFGYHVDTRPPNLTDGVFFPKYVEEVPGVQIERLPPYVATLNPGFDPSLPLFKPMAMFDAIKAALDPRGPQPSPWDKVPGATPPAVHPAAKQKIAKVGFIGSLDGPLYQSLYALGVPLVTGVPAAQAQILVVDGEQLSAADAVTARKLIDATTARGGLAWVMVREKGASLDALGPVFPGKVSVTDRTATSLVRSASSPFVDAFQPGDLYFFTKEGDVRIQKAGLGGPLVEKGRTLLSASNTDWSLFESQPEAAKCAAMLIYEHLKKPAGAALVEVPKNNGLLWISTLDVAPTTAPFAAFWTQLWKNLGVDLVKPPVNWLVAGGPDAKSTWRYTTNPPPDGWTAPAFNDSSWSTGQGGFGTEVPNGKPATPWKTPDIYLRQKFQLAQVPRAASLVFHHDEDVTVFLNGVEVFADKGAMTNYKTVELDRAALRALKPGSNVIAVQCHQTVGGQFVDVGLSTGALPPRGASKGHDLLLDGPTEAK